MGIDKKHSLVKIFSAPHNELATLERDINSYLTKYVGGEYEILTCATDEKLIVTIVY